MLTAARDIWFKLNGVSTFNFILSNGFNKTASSSNSVTSINVAVIKYKILPNLCSNEQGTFCGKTKLKG